MATFTKNGKAKISGKVGEAFSAHGGYISGIDLELVENKHIVQAWRAKNWPKGLYSIADFKLEKDGTGIKLAIDHTGLPEKEVEHLADGGKKMYWEKLTEYFV
ncbi:MAG: SRPBCC domain-containing protein [Aestuariivirga sp.]